VARVEAFAPQDATDLARGAAGVEGLEHLKLVLRRERAPAAAERDLRGRDGRPGREPPGRGHGLTTFGDFRMDWLSPPWTLDARTYLSHLTLAHRGARGSASRSSTG
jgi:hypothetical protein